MRQKARGKKMGFIFVVFMTVLGEPLAFCVILVLVFLRAELPMINFLILGLTTLGAALPTHVSLADKTHANKM